MLCLLAKIVAYAFILVNPFLGISLFNFNLITNKRIFQSISQNEGKINRKGSR